MTFNIEEYQSYEIIDGPIKVEAIKILGGANYFNSGPIVLARINLGDYKEVYSNAVPGFYEKLKAKIPSLYEHKCSEGEPGGFFKRVLEGTLWGHIIEHCTIEIQTLAGMDVAYGKTRSTLVEGTYNVIVRFFDDEAGIYAIKAACNLINSLLLNLDFDINPIIHNLILIRENRLLGPSTQSIVDEAEKREIPSLRLDKYNLVQLGTGKHQKRIRATITSDTNFLAVETADNKHLTTVMLKDAGIPVPETIRTGKLNEIIEFYHKINTPLTLKPCEGHLGQKIKYNLHNETEIESAFQWISENENDVIAQPFISGKDYRILVIDYKFTAAVELTPPTIIGNGLKSIQELIDELNADENREYGDKGKLSKISVDQNTLKIIQDKGYHLNSILSVGEALQLKNSGNMKLGGASKDITDSVHPFNRFLAERACITLGLNVAGVDILASDISIPLNEQGGVVLEVNAAPDFRMHQTPTFGQSRNVATALLNMLFPPGKPNRVPLISITGTAGKTITANLINYCLNAEGYKTGICTTEGLYITGNCLQQGDMATPESAALVLKDPTIDVAILETPREGILRSGLGYKFADFGIVLNIHNEHVGQDDIKYLKDLAYTKSVVAEEVYQSGFSILNADYGMILDVEEDLYSKAVFISKHHDNKWVIKHLTKGGIAIYLQENNIVIADPMVRSRSIDITKIPITFNGNAKSMYENILATVATLYLMNIDPIRIEKHLYEFQPSFENMQGRMTFFKDENGEILLDYAHNTISFLNLKEFLVNIDKTKIGVIDATGERSDEEIMELGKIASETYQKIIFYEGYDTRGRQEGEIVNLLKAGALSQGFNEENIEVFTNPQDAWTKSLSYKNISNLIVILSGRGKATWDFIQEQLNKK